MTAAAFLLLALTLVVAAGNWLAVVNGSKALEYVCKPLTMVGLFATALALDVDEPAVRTWFLVAIALCLLGDVLLMLPQDVFVFGLGAFLLGHVAYIVGMHVDGIDVGRFGLGALLVAVALVVIGIPMCARSCAGAEPELAGPVLAYMGVISLMVASALHGAPGGHRGCDALLRQRRPHRPDPVRAPGPQRPPARHGDLPPRPGGARPQPRLSRGP